MALAFLVNYDGTKMELMALVITRLTYTCRKRKKRQV